MKKDKIEKLTKEEIIQKFLEENHYMDESDFAFREDGRLEWFCEHGIGHTVWYPNGIKCTPIHKCDGCCEYIKSINYEEELPITKIIWEDD